jgi:esterase/lipase superfamily enzyme
MTELSIPHLSEDVWLAIAAGVALLILAFAWRAVRHLPTWARRVARLVLVAVVLAPLALVSLVGLEAPDRVAAPPPSDVAADLERHESERIGAPREDLHARVRKKSARPAGEDAVTMAAPPEPSAAPPPSGGSAPPGAPAAPRSTPPPPPPPPAAAPPAPRMAEATQETWDVVPVFYGTDRAVDTNPQRIVFGWGRGRKLHLGRALVTIPKTHEVPQIERPWTLKIPYFDVTVYAESEDPAKHFTMKEIKPLTKEELLALVRERLASSARFKNHAFVFVHGYNTEFDYAVYRTAQIAYDLKFDGAPFLYSWPSGGRVASYTYDRESAQQSEPFLREFLQTVVRETGAKSVSVIAHSMGNQPLLGVLKELKLSAPPGVVISQVIFAAPDVDRDSFENVARDIQGFANGVTLYAAANDRALLVSRRFHGGVPRAGDVPETGPLLVPGVDTIDVTASSMDGLGLNHSGYAENNALLNDIGLLLQTGERPPDRRFPILERIKTGKGDYWRYPRGG